MIEGESNINEQILISRTNTPSNSHRFAKIWVMRCSRCTYEYGCNSCDAHIRSCPSCNQSAAPGEPY